MGIVLSMIRIQLSDCQSVNTLSSLVSVLLEKTFIYKV